MKYSVVIPIYNRPEELRELLESVVLQSCRDFEIIIVEDGSSLSSESVVREYADRLPLRYMSKENGGPASARNFGAAQAGGEYLLFWDSDTTLPEGYFDAVDNYLLQHPDTGLFGGPDKSSDNFTPLQKAIGYSMTSFFTTGGIRGGKRKISRFIPRSFNMGVRKELFDAVKGFAPMRFGEDMDFSMRVMERIQGTSLKSALIPDAALYHKRRSTLKQFYRQVRNSGRARIDLTLRHKGSLKLVHLLPLFFTLGSAALVLAAILLLSLWPLAPLALYAILLFVDAGIKEKSPYVGLLSVVVAFVQLYAYGLGFVGNWWTRCVLKRGLVSNIDNDRFYR